MKINSPFKAYKYFWYSVIPILILSYIYREENSPIDIPIHDTHIVIQHAHVGLFACICIIFIGSMYFLLRNTNLIKTLSITHVFSTLICPIIYNMGVFLIKVIIENDNNEFSYYEYDKIFSYLLSIPILLFIVGQILFLINITQAILRKAFSKSKEF